MKGFYYILTIYLVSLSPSIAVGQSSELPSDIETLFKTLKMKLLPLQKLNSAKYFQMPVKKKRQSQH
jgi:hypothetical protein